MGECNRMVFEGAISALQRVKKKLWVLLFDGP